jgi:hypothetical protein
VRATGALVWWQVVCGQALAAQAIPALGADHAPGSAGVETFTSGIDYGLARNPALIGASHSWTVGFSASGSSTTDVSERSVAATVGLGRIAFGLRATARKVDDLFDDPALENGDLRVQDTELSLGVSAKIGSRLRIGALGYLVSTEVLGTSGEGTGYRIGLQALLPLVSLGITYGQIQSRMGWEAVNTPSFSSPGTDRLAVGAEVSLLKQLPLHPVLTAELNRDRGEVRDNWVRGNLTLSLVGPAVRAIGGLAYSQEQPSRTYSELGVLLSFSRFDLGLGVRFGADPIPGDSYMFGGQAHSR